MNNFKKYLEKKESQEYIVDYQRMFNKYDKSAEEMLNEDKIKIFNSDVNERVNLYFNFPWCERRCLFCNYTNGIKNESMHSAYINNLLDDYKRYKGLFDKSEVTSIFFGGGTPSILNVNLLNYYLENIMQITNLTKSYVVTVESNINNLYEEKLEIISKYANRISIGVQSFEKNVRLAANMLFEQDEIIKRLRLAREYIKNMNIDLIYGMVNQSEKKFLNDIELCINEKIPSVTLYRLELHKNLAYSKMALNGNSILDYEFQCSCMYMKAQEIFENAGYIENPSGWFVKKQCTEEKWNNRVSDWKSNKSYIGFGNGAYSHLDNYYLSMICDVDTWSQEVKKGNIPIEFIREKSNFEKEMKSIIRIMRTEQKIRKVNITEGLFTDLEIEKLEATINTFLKYNLVIEEGEEYKLTKIGKGNINWLISDLILNDVRQI
ncbi:radical SAM protein [Anaeromicropila populeti]|uniref:Heme chaperone HemW n=1 Tax=Anaeromicropila populeti TaxID=37658 RepID=A0A1I6LVI4_9FIRM|nr:radical SAM protein [Anaeromicropila populeti]SFS07481.1 Coproporphyrinogen III oxidase [Anaeromicropila populeti]